MQSRNPPCRKDERVIIHFDYDCFYASVFEAANPVLKSLPFAVQQKQIIVTCNYEARRRGLYKLQLLTDAKRICPDLIVELGEDISRFRDASKELYNFIKSYSWNGRVERLGFDEVWMDVSDIVSYNLELLNRSVARHFFLTSKDDPTIGFDTDLSTYAGHAWPSAAESDNNLTNVDTLTLRLRLGSHLALHIRHQLEQQKGYTSTVGIATNKLLSKLVGNVNKPKGQTVLLPPLEDTEERAGNVAAFMNDHDIGKVPGIGFKIAQKLRESVLGRPAGFDKGLVYGGTMERVTVSDVREHPDTGQESISKLLSGPGTPRDLGDQIWGLLHGVDDSPVAPARLVPSQISQEDSYIRLDTLPELIRELSTLSQSLLNRMKIDLLGTDDEIGEIAEDKPDQLVPLPSPKRWLAHPKTIRLTTRPRQPLQPDGTRQRSFKRISHSGPLPTFVFSLTDRVEALAERLVRETLLGMFRKLHPEKSGWNLSLVNLAVTNMVETGGRSRTAGGRDIGGMFRRQEDVLKDFRVTEPADGQEQSLGEGSRSLEDEVDDQPPEHGIISDGGWDDEGPAAHVSGGCKICGLPIPSFAMGAHERFHQS